MPDGRPALQGIFLPVTTPFDARSGDIAPVSMRENLRRWLVSPVDGIVLFGWTGEGASLDPDEKERLVTFARDVVPAPITLVAGASAESTRGGIHQAKALAGAGADAVLVQPPSYFGPILEPSALREHFLAVADGSPVPIIIEHIPAYTHVVLESGLVSELARHQNVAAIVDSSGDLKRLAGYVDACAQRCSVLSGAGANLYAALELGAVGGVVAVGLLAPDWCTELMASFRSGRPAEAGALQERIGPLERDVVRRFGVPGVKAALDLLGFAGGVPRRPLVPLREKEHRTVSRALHDAGLL